MALIILLAAILVVFTVHLLFCRAVYLTMKAIPEPCRIFPAWFAWMMGIPFLHLVFSWLMLPFGLPRSIEKYFTHNAEASRHARTLFGIGLALTIVLSLLLFFNFVAMIVALLLYIIYWVKLNQFRSRIKHMDRGLMA